MPDIVLWCLLAGGVIVSGGTFFMARDLTRRIQEWTQMVGETKLITEWKSAGPMTQRVETTQNSGESLSDFIARHQATVDALKAVYPPIQ